jgi:hypothetical protein
MGGKHITSSIGVIALKNDSKIHAYKHTFYVCVTEGQLQPLPGIHINDS